MSRLAALAALFLAAGPAVAGTVTVTFTDAAGAALEDGVAWLQPKAPTSERRGGSPAVEQVNKTFVPLVTVVQVGTAVQFPNRDEIRHHVYSFSPAKRFEIKLYVGTPADPVVFDKPGEVVLGCNIHDHMIAYVYVVDSPWFAKAGPDGQARIANVPPGEYELRSWHYAQAGEVPAQAVRIKADETVSAKVGVVLRPRARRPGTAP